MAKKLKLWLVFLFPIIVSSFVLFARDAFYFSPNNNDLYVEIKPNSVFFVCHAYFVLFSSYALFYVASLINKKVFAVTLAGLMYATSFVYMAHFFITGQYIHQNSIFVVLDTNILEIMDFFRALTFTTVLKTVLLAAFYIAVPVMLLRGIFPLDAFQRKKTAFGLFLIALLGTAGLEFISVYSGFEPFTQVAFAVSEYTQGIKRIKKTADMLVDEKIAGITSSVPAETQETYVIVIGESASRLYHPLYIENPLAPSPLKDMGIKIFNNVFSAAAITEASFEAMFYKPLPSEETRKYLTFPDFLKSAGFKTFWLSNQFRIGESDNLTGLLANRSDTAVFTNTSDSYQKNYSHVPLDEELIPHFEAALNDPAPKKVIFVHLFGSHLPFFRRFPADLKIEEENPNFAPALRKSSLTASEFKEKMDYSKSLYYTDTLLKQMIRDLERKGGYTSLIYFSDHGTDPVVSMNRTDDSVVLSIPFFVWTSPAYDRFNTEKVAQMAAAANTEYVTNRLFSTLADWMNLNRPALTPETDSLFSPKLAPLPSEPQKQ